MVSRMIGGSSWARLQPLVLLLFGLVALLAAIFVDHANLSFALWAVAGGSLSACLLMVSAAMLTQGRLRAGLRAALRIMEEINFDG